MKTLIVYYSHEGNTDFVAKKIAEKTILVLKKRRLQPSHVKVELELRKHL